MKPRERMLAALRFRQPDDMVPAWEIEFQLFQELLGRAPIVGHDYGRLSLKEKERAANSNVEVMIAATEATHQCAILNIGGYWEVGPGEPAPLWLPERGDQLTQVRLLKQLAGDHYLILGRAGYVPGIPTGADMAEYCYHLYDNLDEEVGQAAARMSDSIEWGKQMLDAGADGVVMAADVAFNKGPFLPPPLVERLITPNVYLWAQTFKRLGAVTIWHTDGNVAPLMDMMADAGVTALQAIDPIAGMDIRALKRKYHRRLALVGNVNCVTLQFGTPEAIEQECRAMLEGCKEGGGYVFGCTNAVFKGIPIENYKVAIRALERYGAYGSPAPTTRDVES